MTFFKTKFIWTILAFALMVDFAAAQVAKNVVVEHYTNTVCSICSSRNPGFYQNLNGQTGVFHIAYHPSSPYSSCVFSQHNALENDSRTNYYSIYGSTPRLVIQGDVVGVGENYGSSSIFTPYLNQTTPISIELYQNKSNTDSIKATVVLEAVAANSLSNLELYVGVAEDTIFYSAPNGESQHYDVFRRAMASGYSVDATMIDNVGEKLVLEFGVPTHVDWDFDRMFTYVILQDATTKEVIQSAVVTPQTNTTYSSIENLGMKDLGVSVYPNPIQQTLSIRTENITTIQLSNTLGQVVLQKQIAGDADLNVDYLDTGIYWLLVETKAGYSIEKIIKR